MTVKIPLMDWAARHYAPAPSIQILRQWVKSKELKARLIGGAYFVDENASRKAPRVTRGGRIVFGDGQPIKVQLPRKVQSAEARHKDALRRARTLQRLASWADLDAILSMHAEARRLTVETGIVHHVDHQIPLQGKLVSGLHVHNNMQILTAQQNGRKRNKFEVA